MCRIFVCQIVDLLSKRITHTFMASGHEHAIRQFQSFLKSLEGKIHYDDFVLQVCDYVEVPESFSEAELFGFDASDDVHLGDEVMKDES